MRATGSRKPLRDAADGVACSRRDRVSTPSHPSPAPDYSKNEYDVKWSPGCWWGKPVVVFGPSGLRKDHEVVAFLARDGKAASLHVFPDGCVQLMPVQGRVTWSWQEVCLGVAAGSRAFGAGGLTGAPVGGGCAGCRARRRQDSLHAGPAPSLLPDSTRWQTGFPFLSRPP